MSTFALGLLMTLAAQAPSVDSGARALELTGTIREAAGGIGGKARALLKTDDGKSFEVHGSTDTRQEELRRLSSVKVKLWGVTGDPRIPAGDHLLVERYEILDVGGGVVPRVGKIALLSMNGKEHLIFVDKSGHADLLPSGWSKKMKQHVGAKVWMVGTGSGAKFKPTKFSVLKTRTSSAEKAEP